MYFRQTPCRSCSLTVLNSLNARCSRCLRRFDLWFLLSTGKSALHFQYTHVGCMRISRNGRRVSWFQLRNHSSRSSGFRMPLFSFQYLSYCRSQVKKPAQFRSKANIITILGLNPRYLLKEFHRNTLACRMTKMNKILDSPYSSQGKRKPVASLLELSMTIGGSARSLTENQFGLLHCNNFRKSPWSLNLLPCVYDCSLTTSRWFWQPSVCLRHRVLTNPWRLGY